MIMVDDNNMEYGSITYLWGKVQAVVQCSVILPRPGFTVITVRHWPPPAVVVVAGSRFKFERVLNVIYGRLRAHSALGGSSERQPAEVVSLPSFNKFNYPNYA